MKIKKIFRIEIKNHVREILFRIHNQFIDFMNFIEFCDKINQNYYYYQRDRSKYSNLYFVFYRTMSFSFVLYSFRFVKNFSK